MPQTLEPVLRRHGFFAGIDPEYLALIAGCARNVVFRDGTFLFREGDPAETFYLVREGAVALEITAPGRVATLQTLGAGEMVGFSWLMGPHRWHFDGRAVGHVHAIEMDGTCLRAFGRTGTGLTPAARMDSRWLRCRVCIVRRVAQE